MKHRLFFLILSFAILSCKGQPTKKIESVAPEVFAEKIKATSNAQILDVRTPEEFASEHIDKATNINWLGDDFVTNVENLDKSKPVFVYCKSGGRSAKASAKLAELGFKTIYELQGGIMKWNAAGFSKPSKKIVGISSQEYAELLNSDKKVLIDFYAEWCAPCKKMNPYILKFQTEMKARIKIVQLDADENKTIVYQMRLEGLPTLIIYEKGIEVWRNVGFISEEDLKKNL